MPKKTKSSNAKPSAGRDGDLFLRAMPAMFVFIWSTGFLVAKFGSTHAPPLTFLSWRYAVAALLLLPLILLSRARWPEFSQIRHIAIAGVLVHAFYLAGVWCSIDLGMPAGVTALIVGLQPILTGFAGSWVGERVGARHWGGLLLGFAGVALVLSDKIVLTGLSVASIALSIMALLGITGGTLYQKRFCPHFDLRVGGFIQYTVSFVISAPIALLLEQQRVDWNANTLFALAWSVLALSLGAIFLLFLLIRRGAATRVASLFYLTPPLTALMTWWLFDEMLSFIAILGMLLAVVGVALVNMRKSVTQA